MAARHNCTTARHSLVTVGRRPVADVDGMVDVVNRATGVKQVKGAKNAEGTRGPGGKYGPTPAERERRGEQPWATGHHRRCHQDNGVTFTTSAWGMPSCVSGSGTRHGREASTFWPKAVT